MVDKKTKKKTCQSECEVRSERPADCSPNGATVNSQGRWPPGYEAHSVSSPNGTTVSMPLLSDIATFVSSVDDFQGLTPPGY